MALNTSKCNRLTPLRFKGLICTQKPWAKPGRNWGSVPHLFSRPLLTPHQLKMLSSEFTYFNVKFTNIHGQCSSLTFYVGLQRLYPQKTTPNNPSLWNPWSEVRYKINRLQYTNVRALYECHNHAVNSVSLRTCVCANCDMLINYAAAVDAADATVIILLGACGIV